MNLLPQKIQPQKYIFTTFPRQKAFVHVQTLAHVQLRMVPIRYCLSIGVMMVDWGQVSHREGSFRVRVRVSIVIRKHAGSLMPQRNFFMCCMVESLPQKHRACVKYVSVHVFAQQLLGSDK